MDRRVDARTQAHVLKALVNRNPSHKILIYIFYINTTHYLSFIIYLLTCNLSTSPVGVLPGC